MQLIISLWVLWLAQLELLFGQEIHFLFVDVQACIVWESKLSRDSDLEFEKYDANLLLLHGKLRFFPW